MASTMKRMKGRSGMLEDTLLCSPAVTGVSPLLSLAELNAQAERDAEQSQQLVKTYRQNGNNSDDGVVVVVGNQPLTRKLLPVMPFQFVKAVLENFYPVGEGMHAFVDTQYTSTNFLASIALRRNLQVISPMSWSIVVAAREDAKHGRKAARHGSVVNQMRSNMSDDSSGNSSDFCVAMDKYLMNSLLWDTNLFIEHGEIEHHHHHHHYNKQAARIEENHGAHVRHSRYPLLLRTQVLAGSNPELTITAVKKLFQSYSEILNDAIHKV